MKTILNSQHPLILKLAASVLVFLSVFVTGINSESFAAAEKVTFAAYGDMPYFAKSADGRTDEQVLIQDIAPKFRQREDIPFVIHLGDLGRPQDTCYDTWLEKNKTFWKSDIVKPVFFTPGDNDWTDCDREGLTVRKSELERLDAIRRVFFSQPKTLNPEWRYEEQATLPENETWWYKGVRFVT
ncbi:hypothetical protein PN478_20505 [Dolichospermum circinale CS-534/05]|uniref:hypothetical protein n=1 Tax=Dolichospermum circinale TaxID=109265 RepID=UPI00232AD166|nr:hypothetical protein [Dolichospermum circinale]MDB9492883.1 hypothetical protein [Dolichospermum circinale CS-534/05]